MVTQEVSSGLLCERANTLDSVTYIPSHNICVDLMMHFSEKKSDHEVTYDIIFETHEKFAKNILVWRKREKERNMKFHFRWSMIFCVALKKINKSS